MCYSREFAILTILFCTQLYIFHGENISNSTTQPLSPTSPNISMSPSSSLPTLESTHSPNITSTPVISTSNTISTIASSSSLQPMRAHMISTSATNGLPSTTQYQSTPLATSAISQYQSPSAISQYQSQSNSPILTSTSIPSMSLHPQSTASASTASPLTTSYQPTTSGSPTTEPTQAPTRLFNCTCDLTFSGCDVNCCCDIDCDEETKTGVFTCDQNEAAAASQSCVRTDFVYLFNSLGSFRDGILCVQIDNNPFATRYTEPIRISDLESFQNAVNSYGPTFQYPKPYMPPSQPVFYRLGDPVCAVYTHNSTPYTTYLSLPRGVASSTCNAHSPVRFYTDSQSTCTQLLDPLQLACTAGSVLDATAYTERVRIFTLPRCYTLTPSNLTDPTLSVHTSCVDSNSDPVPCPDPLTPLYNATTNSCYNALTRISYSITANGTLGISSINATLTLSHTATPTLQQKFSVQFSSLSDGPSPVSLSGSPGYRDGYPVIVANLLSPGTNTTRLVSQTLTILQPLPVCDTTKRVNIGFRRNTNSGCIYRFNILDLNSNCSRLQDETRSLLIGKLYNFVGIFGNSQLTPDSVNTDLWVASMYEESPLQPQQNAGCSLSTQLTVQLLIASTGSLASPERSIRGMKYRLYYSSVDSTCTGGTCQFQTDSTHKSLFISSTVEFIDISEEPQVRRRVTPGTSNILPDDFFFPFLVSSADKLQYSAICIILYAITNWFIALY